MRPHVNGYSAHENVLQTAHKTPLRQQVAATSCNLATYQPFHAALNTNNSNKWSPNLCYNGVRVLQHQQQQQQQPPIHYHATAANYQILPHAGNQQQHAYQHQQQQQQPHMHPHLQRLNHFTHGGNISNGNFVPTPSLPPAGTEAMTHNYAKLPPHAVNQQRINECAGIPLISNASTHLAPTQRQRLIRKSSQSPPHAAATHPHLMGLRKDAYTAWNLPPTATANCISQLAVRTHGLPLLHNNINNNNNHWQNVTTSYENRCATYATINNNLPSTHTATIGKSSGKLEKSRLLRYQNSAPAVLSTIDNAGIESNEEAITNNNETKVMTETCLPRIIKPRKRRKKDRKPTANNMHNNNNNNNNNIFITHHMSMQNAARTMQANISDNVAVTKQYKSTENIEEQKDKYQSNANSLMPFYAMGLDQLTPKSTTTTNVLWNLTNENNLRSIWDYPLRRSFSDTSANSSNIKLASTPWDIKSGTSSTSSSSSSSASSSSSSSYSLSNLSADSFFSADLYASQTLTPSRAEIVGVIGSNRHMNDITQKQQKHHLNDIDNIPRKPLLSACFSDSNDSGYGDILTGINIVNDLFNHRFTTTTTSTAVCKLNTNPVDNFALLSTADTTTNANNKTLLHAADEAASLLLLPETAETLLNESINEISRKLIETCGNETLNDFPDTHLTEIPHSASFSTCSDFSNDSGIEANSNNNMTTNNLLNCNELIFNFENLHMNKRNNDLCAGAGTPSIQQFSTLSKLASTMENFLMHLNSNDSNNNTLSDENNNTYAAVNINNNNDNNNNNNKNNNPEEEQQHNQQFVKNCLNLVWPNGNEEVREPPITTMLNSMVELNTTAFSLH